MNWEKACNILGVAVTASEQEIVEQYRYKVQLLHPDWNSSKPATVRIKAEQELMQVNEAYNVLRNSKNRPPSHSPKLELSVKEVHFKEVDLGQKKSTSFEVKSVGGTYTKIWIDDSPAPWLRVTDIRSFTGEVLPLEVTIEATGIGVPNQRFTCDLAIRLENEQTKAKDEVVVRVALSMKAEPGILKLDKHRFRFRFVRPGAQKLMSLEISNTGQGLLQGHLFTTRPWLLISHRALTIAPLAKTTCTMSVATDKLSSGFTDKAFINIITNGGNDRVQVDLSMMPFSLNKLFRVPLYVVLESLLALPVVISVMVGIDQLRILLDYFQLPFFWVGAGISFSIVFGIIFAFVFTGIRVKRKKRRL